MTIQTTDWAKEIESRYRDRLFLTISDLVDLGLFDNIVSARIALYAGRLPFMYISKRRAIIPKSDLLAYLQKGFRGSV